MNFHIKFVKFIGNIAEIQVLRVWNRRWSNVQQSSCLFICQTVEINVKFGNFIRRRVDGAEYRVGRFRVSLEIGRNDIGFCRFSIFKACKIVAGNNFNKVHVKNLSAKASRLQ